MSIQGGVPIGVPFPSDPFIGQAFGQWKWNGRMWVTGPGGLVAYPPIPPATILGNAEETDRIAMPLTGDQVTALLDVFTPFLKGLVPPSGGNTAVILRGDGWGPFPTGALDFQGVVAIPPTDPGTAPGQMVLVQSTDTLWIWNGTDWVDTGHSAAGGIAEAPTDGNLYGRQNASWVVIPPATVPGPPEQRLVTASASILATDEIVNTNITTADQVLLLPSYLAMNGRLLEIGDVGGVATANPFSIATQSGESISGQNSIEIAVDYASVRLRPANDGTTAGWFIRG